MAGKGGAIPGAGRKTKAEEMLVRNIAIDAITAKYGGLKEGFEALLNTKEPSLIKWVFEHAAGKPQEKIDITSGGNQITGMVVK